jgi:hypothetical protein
MNGHTKQVNPAQDSTKLPLGISRSPYCLTAGFGHNHNHVYIKAYSRGTNLLWCDEQKKPSDVSLMRGSYRSCLLEYGSRNIPACINKRITLNKQTKTLRHSGLSSTNTESQGDRRHFSMSPGVVLQHQHNLEHLPLPSCLNMEVAKGV